MRNLEQILKRAVGAGTDTNLVDFLCTDFLNCLDIVGGVGAGCEGNKLGEVDVYLLVINRVGVSAKGSVVLLTTLSLKEAESCFVRGEDRGGCAKLCALVCDGCTLGNGEACNADAAVLHYLANAALNGQNTQNLKDNVLCGNPVVELACEVDFYNLGHGYVVSAAAHCNSYVKSACTHCKHADTAACGGMAVRADEGLARLAEALKVYLMADTVAGAGEPDTVLLCDRADEAVVVSVLKAALECVVVDVSDGALCLYAVNAHSLKLKISHGACSVLSKGLVDFKTDFLSLYHLAVNNMRFDDFFG